MIRKDAIINVIMLIPAAAVFFLYVYFCVSVACRLYGLPCCYNKCKGGRSFCVTTLSAYRSALSWEKYWAAYTLIKPAAAFPLDQMISSMPDTRRTAFAHFSRYCGTTSGAPLPQVLHLCEAVRAVFYLKEHAALTPKRDELLCLLMNDY